MQKENIDAICMGHTHFPFKVKFEESNKWVINAGSVGQPRDDIPFPCTIVFQIESKEIVDVYHHKHKWQHGKICYLSML